MLVKYNLEIEPPNGFICGVHFCEVCTDCIACHGGEVGHKCYCFVNEKGEGLLRYKKLKKELRKQNGTN